ncbi:hypothetical protein Hte_007440 [Hypoxylon texense]
MDSKSSETRFESLTYELQTLQIPFKTAADSDWLSWAKTYNVSIPVTPAVVVCPVYTIQIGVAVKLARRYGLKVQARSGGHSYASHSNGGVDGAMVIDLRKLDIVLCRPPSAFVYGGARLGQMAQTIYTKSGHALPHGTCAAVGVGGHFTHGGFGFFSRAWGLAMDRITGLGVVTADGEDRHVSETKFPDLYYALRGAADSFGIVHLFYLSSLPAPESVVHWKVRVPGVAGNIEACVSVFQHLQAFVHGRFVDRQWGLNLSLASDYFGIDGTYLGSADELRIILSMLVTGLEVAASTETPIVNQGGPLVVWEISEMNWPDTLKALNSGQDIVTETSMHDKQDNFFAKSVVIPEPGLDEKTLRSFFTYLMEAEVDEKFNKFILFDLWGGTDSQINTKDVNFSAFPHRDVCWVAQMYGYVGLDQQMPPCCVDYIDRLAGSITKYLPRKAAYLNYTDPSLTRQEAHKQYYGKDLYKILSELKQKWDPDNVFSNPQSI